MNPYGELRSESTEKSEDDLERGIGVGSRSSRPPTTAAINHVPWTGRSGFIPVCLILVVGLSVKLLLLERRVGHLEQMMATAPCRQQLEQKTVLTWFPDSSDRTSPLNDLDAQTDSVNEVVESQLTSLFASDDEDGNAEDDSDDAAEHVDDIDDEIAADYVSDTDDRSRQLTIKDVADGAGSSKPLRRIRRSSDVVVDDEIWADTAAGAGTYMTDSMLHDRSRGDRIRRHKSDKATANAEGAQRSSTRGQPAGGKKQPAPKQKQKNDPAFLLTMNAQIPAEYVQRIKAGETVNLTHGVVGPNGYRPTKASDSDRSYVYRSWKVEDWAKHNQVYSYNQANGHVTVKKTGIYFIYAQILYHNAAARSMFAIYAEKRVLVKCWTGVDVVTGNSTDNSRFKTCYVGIATMLERDQSVWVEDMYGNEIRTDSDATYFGLIKLADL